MRFIGGNDGRVWIVEGSPRPLGSFEWGAVKVGPINRPVEGNYRLAKALLMEVLPEKAEKFYVRFMDHAFRTKNHNEPWTYTSEEIIRLVDDLAKTEREAAPMTRGGLREAAGVPMEANPAAGMRHKDGTQSSGYGGNDSAPDRKR